MKRKTSERCWPLIMRLFRIRKQSQYNTSGSLLVAHVQGLRRLSEGDCQDSNLSLSYSVRPVTQNQVKETETGAGAKREIWYGMVWWYMLAIPIHQR